MSEPIPQSWVADFHLVDPSTLASKRDINAARLMTVRARLRGRPTHLLNRSDRDRYKAIGPTVQNLAHDGEPSMLSYLEGQATFKTIQQFYYCSRCGEKLTPQRCPQCNIRYTLGDQQQRLMSRIAPPVIPPIIAAYAVQQGTRFRQFVIRPRQP
jgi:hypothetical protein